jgi:predicted nucleotide-binding protein
MPSKIKIGRIRIEYIQNQVPFSESEELVVILNGSKQKVDLKGWRLIYENLSTGEVLHTHYFHKLNGSFDPGERLCVSSCVGEDHFQESGAEVRFPGPHWDLHTDHALHLLNLPRIRVRLIDEDGNVLDSMSVERTSGKQSTTNAVKIFIGHGGDPQWRDLKDHLQDKHSLTVIAYEIGLRAGLSVKEVLEQMLEDSSFALLVLTGEDIHTDGEAHARENVIHELGLFQGKIGFTRAIALVEEGVKEFSNILGINQIRFSKGRVRETFGEVIATIKRELTDLR